MQVCGVLVQLLWEGLTRWVTRHHQVPNRKHIAAYAEELCEIEVWPMGSGGVGVLGRLVCGGGWWGLVRAGGWGLHSSEVARQGVTGWATVQPRVPTC